MTTNDKADVCSDAMKGIRWWFTFAQLKLRGVGSRDKPLPLKIFVDSFSVGGLSFRTLGSLEAFLLSYRPDAVQVLMPNKDASYPHVAAAMRAVQKAGAWTGIVGY